MDWEKTTAKNGFVSYEVSTGEVYGLSEEVVQAKKRVRVIDGVPTTATLAAVLVTTLAGV